MWLAKVDNLHLLQLMQMIEIDVLADTAKDLNSSFFSYQGVIAKEDEVYRNQ